ncbi:flagellar biosynthesis protein FlhB [Agathobacter sp.]|uniref:flagellar biosynthesis protein FlhB n=1 Tax=Agathobacter sp. TaxID=2021311 RepID=UPI0025900D7F|nr:flagellar biosynthesis protein FlhB [Agathobacter sp.]
MKTCADEYQNFTLKFNLQLFAQDGEGGEKTEPATQKKLNDARKEGKVAKSKELTAAFDLIVLFLVLKIFISFVGENLVGIISYVYNGFPDFISVNEAGLSTIAVRNYMINIMLKTLLILLPFLLFGVVITFLISVIQVGWKVSTKPMEPKLSKFNPINGFKRIFSKDSVFELLKAFVKIFVIGVVAYLALRGDADKIFILYDLSLNQAVALVGSLIIDTGLKVSLVYLVVGIADYVYQKRKFANDMKMTKQEVKDEYKNTEGDPQIKGRQRQRMREASQRRMMQDVPKADVVITNPTHLAVALQYEGTERKAPVVIAKGEDFLAQKIKEIAKESGVEIVENKPLARMLYHNVDLGAEIPPELYQAVAEVLAAIYRKKHPNG